MRGTQGPAGGQAFGSTAELPVLPKNSHDIEGRNDGKPVVPRRAPHASFQVSDLPSSVVLSPLARVFPGCWHGVILQQDENIMYGRRVSPTLDEALSLPPPWQILAEEDVTLQDMIIQDLVAGEMARCVHVCPATERACLRLATGDRQWSRYVLGVHLHLLHVSLA